MTQPISQAEAALRDAERNARLDTSSPLPLQVSTLAWIPEANRVQYTRTMDGTFRLDFIYDSDHANRAARVEELASGKITILPDGETPESLAKQNAANAELFKAAMAKVEAADRQEREAALAARLAKEQAKTEEEMARIRAEYGLPTVAPDVQELRKQFGYQETPPKR